ncbi:hypothetical protein PQ465_11910 [Sphingobacterium oryzagri]|uniref:Lasso RiPP family leader peptide-containing protein n=1 Tax=Sphingobacterium oryzagri TaxID=3025669 RepID=A0ABY7WBG8_9SPHI|nr:hypothetical protein [Sphingobacterium sp. KACC 22765]WDF67011.1 hypothetical protein PQ465_11910 [Sphingobacterium sp. KACC 22765]
MSKATKREYISPQIEVCDIKLERGFVAGSAVIRPMNQNNQVVDEWDTEDNETKTYNW